MTQARPVDRVVVGAGMSGLADAFYAQRRGESVVLLEAAARVGGVIDTRTTHGYRHEAAATSIPSSARSVLALLEAVGASDLLAPASDAAKAQFLLTGDGLVRVPRSPSALLRSGLLGPGATLRALGEFVRGRGAPPTDETLHAFVARRFGRAVADTFLRPFTNGIYGCAPEKLGAADAFPRLVALEQRRGGVLRGLAAGGLGGSASAAPRQKREVLMPVGGMASLPAAVAAALGPAVETDVAVTRVDAGAPGQAARVHAADGRVWDAHAVTLAMRAPAQAALVAPQHPDVAARLRDVAYVPMVVCAVGYGPGDGPAPPEGFGFLRGPGSTARILGATCNSRLDPGVAPAGGALLTVYIGGSEDPTAVDLDDAALRETVLGDLAGALGGAIEPTLFHVTRWRRAIPVFAPGHRGRMAAANAELAQAGIRLLGSHVTGVSLADCCRPATPIAGPLPPGLVRL